MFKIERVMSCYCMFTTSLVTKSFFKFWLLIQFIINFKTLCFQIRRPYDGLASFNYEFVPYSKSSTQLILPMQYYNKNC